jgi:hypothetical protein
MQNRNETVVALLCHSCLLPPPLRRSDFLFLQRHGYQLVILPFLLLNGEQFTAHDVLAAPQAGHVLSICRIEIVNAQL